MPIPLFSLSQSLANLKVLPQSTRPLAIASLLIDQNPTGDKDLQLLGFGGWVNSSIGTDPLPSPRLSSHFLLLASLRLPSAHGSVG